MENETFEGFMLAKQAKMINRNEYLKNSDNYKEICDDITEAIERGYRHIFFNSGYLHSAIIKYLITLGYHVIQEPGRWLITW